MNRLEQILKHLIPNFSSNLKSTTSTTTPLYQKQNNRIELRQKLVDASLSIFETTNLFYFSILFVIFFRFSKQFVQQILKQGTNAGTNFSRSYSLLEPIIATMMLYTFSVFYNQMKQNILNNLKRLEDEVLLYNKMMSLANAFLRKQQNRAAVYLQRDWSGKDEPLFPPLEDDEEEVQEDITSQESILKAMKKLLPTTAMTVLQEDLSRRVHIKMLIQPVHEKLYQITLQGFYNMDSSVSLQKDDKQWKHISIQYLPQSATIEPSPEDPKPIISMKFLLPKNPQIDWNDTFEVNYGAIL